MSFVLPRGTLLVSLIVLAAALDLRIALRPDGDRLPNEALGAARTAVRNVQKPGDLLVHSPLFSLSEQHALGDLPTSSHVPPPKLRQTRRIILIDRTDYPIYGMSDPAQTIEVPQSDGLLEVKIYEPKGVIDVPLYSLKESILPATMHVERPSGNITARCTVQRGEGGYSCPGEPDWLYVSRRTLRIDGEDTECVWAHPTTNGVIVLTIPAQPPPPAGRKLVLELAGGFNDDAVRMTGDGSPVRADVVQKKQIKGTITTPNRIGWVRSRIDVEAGEPIELRFTTPNDGRRHYCTNAEILEIAQ